MAMKEELIQEFETLVDGSITISQDNVRVLDAEKFQKNIQKLAEVAALAGGVKGGYARFVIRMAALDLGIFPASINELYMARGRGEVPFTFTTPAINLRAMTFEAARAVFRTAVSMDAASFIFEIARSEMTYTDQRPTEYTSSILAAAIAEGYRGPVFVQGDHFQVSAKRYAAEPVTEIESLKALIIEAVAGGFFNIDVDTSTLVDLSKETIPDQQKVNVDLSASLTAFIRSVEPAGVTISVGGEIGEVGGHNSTEEELRAYLDGYKAELKRLVGGVVGLSKISIQTGTSHGGVVLPDGSIAKVDVDFGTMLKLTRISRSDYGLGGAVQHGASTLPENAFGHFVEAEAVEIHLATNFQNIFFEHMPTVLREEIYAFLSEKFASERKPGMTDEQFFYKTRKSAVGPFTKQSWLLPVAVRAEIGKAWEDQFQKLFTMLGLAGTRQYVDRFIGPMVVKPKLVDYLGKDADAEDVKDLAD
jgi:fructose/tagatose bisphosphate aldolase